MGGGVDVFDPTGIPGLSFALRIGAVVGLGRAVPVVADDGVGVIATGAVSWAGAGNKVGVGKGVYVG